MTSATVIAVFVAAIAAVLDHRARRIPDALTMGGLGIGIGLAVDHGPWPLARVIMGAFALLAFCVVLSTRRRAIGGGDTKLLIAMAALLGVVGAIVAGAVAAVVIRVLPPKIEQPAAPAILVGVLVFVLVREVLLSC